MTGRGSNPTQHGCSPFLSPRPAGACLSSQSLCPQGVTWREEADGPATHRLMTPSGDIGDLPQESAIVGGLLHEPQALFQLAQDLILLGQGLLQLHHLQGRLVSQRTSTQLGGLGIYPLRGFPDQVSPSVCTCPMLGVPFSCTPRPAPIIRQEPSSQSPSCKASSHGPSWLVSLTVFHDSYDFLLLPRLSPHGGLLSFYVHPLRSAKLQEWNQKSDGAMGTLAALGNLLYSGGEEPLGHWSPVPAPANGFPQRHLKG